MLFIIYMRSLAPLLDSLKVKYCMYADDTAIYFEFDGTEVDDAKARLLNIITKVQEWMVSRRLVLNLSKTKLILFCPDSLKQGVLRDFGAVQITLSNTVIELHPQPQVKLLGFILDTDP